MGRHWPLHFNVHFCKKTEMETAIEQLEAFYSTEVKSQIMLNGSWAYPDSAAQKLPEPSQPWDTSAQVVFASTLFACKHNDRGASCAIAVAFLL